MKSPVQNLQQQYVGNDRIQLFFVRELSADVNFFLLSNWALHNLHVSYLELEVTGRIIQYTVNFEPLQLDTGFHLPTLITRMVSHLQINFVATLVFYPPLRHCFHFKKMFIWCHTTY